MKAMLKTQEQPTSSCPNWVQILEEEFQGRQTHAFAKGYNIPLYKNDIWIVCQGIVQLCTLDPEGHESILGLACPDMPFGASLTQIAAYEAFAFTDVVLMRIDQAELEQSPSLAQRLVVQLNRRFQQTETLLSITHQCQIKTRIQQLMLLLAKEIGVATPEGKRLRIRFNPSANCESSWNLSCDCYSCSQELTKRGMAIG